MMGDWSVGQWLVGVMRFGLFVWLENHKVEKGSGQVGGRGPMTVFTMCKKYCNFAREVFPKCSGSKFAGYDKYLRYCVGVLNTL